MSIVEYKNITIERGERIVLQNVTFNIQKGEFCYLVGKVGSGKSSLMKSMYAEVPIERGEAKVIDYDITNIKKKNIPF